MNIAAVTARQMIRHARRALAGSWVSTTPLPFLLIVFADVVARAVPQGFIRPNARNKRATKVCGADRPFGNLIGDFRPILTPLFIIPQPTSGISLDTFDARQYERLAVRIGNQTCRF